MGNSCVGINSVKAFNSQVSTKQTSLSDKSSTIMTSQQSLNKDTQVYFDKTKAKLTPKEQINETTYFDKEFGTMKIKIFEDTSDDEITAESNSESSNDQDDNKEDWIEKIKFLLRQKCSEPGILDLYLDSQKTLEYEFIQLIFNCKTQKLKAQKQLNQFWEKCTPTIISIVENDKYISKIVLEILQENLKVLLKKYQNFAKLLSKNNSSISFGKFISSLFVWFNSSFSKSQDTIKKDIIRTSFLSDDLDKFILNQKELFADKQLVYFQTRNILSVPIFE